MPFTDLFFLQETARRKRTASAQLPPSARQHSKWLSLRLPIARECASIRS